MIELSMYRVLTELLNNTMKYADAKNTELFIKKSEDRLYISYADDGNGFDYEETLNRAKGNGLTNMKSRIKALGGSYNYFSEPGKGIKVDIMVLLKQDSYD